MREIKFRAWHKNNKSMCMNVATNLLNRVYLIFMQYTGLKDVNDKEIYEGDIVDATYCIDGCLYYSEDEYGIVVWDEKKCGFRIKFDDKVDTTRMSYYRYFEVVGNIYENPELLKE